MPQIHFSYLSRILLNHSLDACAKLGPYKTTHIAALPRQLRDAANHAATRVQLRSVKYPEEIQSCTQVLFYCGTGVPTAAAAAPRCSYWSSQNFAAI